MPAGMGSRDTSGRVGVRARLPQMRRQRIEDIRNAVPPGPAAAPLGRSLAVWWRCLDVLRHPHWMFA